MKERRRVGGLDQRRRIHPAIAIAGPAAERHLGGSAEPAIEWHRRIKVESLTVEAPADADIEHAVKAALVERGRVAVAERA